ncbi:hypothetical protein VSP10_17060 [Myroides odoratimimus]|uniref:hypothetical protein n=1 Tax=Myroides odoratimimus TaxID=76832 RepID=UPI002DB5DF97|nr:hypothetical protein [Myroides odoratimimus]MEC4054483.1 hypothetical protein [Myroides odoratimimus]
MRRLTIKNVGPIKSITIDLKRINVLIGLQSSGKSTINKIACHCSWVEKELYTNPMLNHVQISSYFIETLIEFHKLEGFFSKDSYIKFETDLIDFSFSYDKSTFSFKWKTEDYWWSYKRNKTIYIPAERNIVAVIPNWFQIKLENTNLRNFLAHWQETRYSFSDKFQPILDLGVNYKYNKEKDTDELYLTSVNKTINIKNASSGLQSIVPLYMLTEYINNEVYNQETKDSVEEVSVKRELKNSIYKSAEKDLSVIDKIKLELKTTESSFQYVLQSVINNLENIQQSNIFLEEPEVNLFPVTQRELVKHLVKSTYHNAEGREHSLFLTTHSPYILTTLNNLIYANDCAKAASEEVKDIIGEEYWVDFNDVGVWFVRDGVVEDILDYEERQIDASKIDEVSQLLNNEFDNLLDTQYHEV